MQLFIICLAHSNIMSHWYPQICTTIASHLNKYSRFLEGLLASPISAPVVSASRSPQKNFALKTWVLLGPSSAQNPLGASV